MLQLQYRQNHHADAIQTANAVQRQQFISQALKTRTWNLSKRARAELQDGETLTWRGSTTQDQHFLRATYRNKLRINVISGTIDTVVARCPLPAARCPLPAARCQAGLFTLDTGTTLSRPDQSGLCLIGVVGKDASFEITEH